MKMSGSVLIFWVTTLRRMTSPLTDQVKVKYSDLPSCWLDTLWLLIRCIVIAQTTNLARLKDHLPAVIDSPTAQRTKPQSHYKRLTRFFEPFSYPNARLAIRLQQLMAELTLRIIGSDRCFRSRLGRELLLDGSEWIIKGTKVQFLTLAILLDGIAVPIAFIDLEKIGHSLQQERIDFFSKMSNRFDLRGMTLIADREYIGLQWFEALRVTFGLNFIVRLKKGVYHQQVNAAKGKSQSEMVSKLKRCRSKKMVSKRIIIDEIAWYYIIFCNPKAAHPDEDEFIYLLSSWFNRAKAVEAYARRWSIEVTFRHFKSNGFRLEDLNLVGRHKREAMMAILNLVFVLCIVEGRKFAQRHPRSQQTKTDHKTGRVTLVNYIFILVLSRVLATLNNQQKIMRRFEKI